jgi:hypothetical protein
LVTADYIIEAIKDIFTKISHDDQRISFISVNVALLQSIHRLQLTVDANSLSVDSDVLWFNPIALTLATAFEKIGLGHENNAVSKALRQLKILQSQRSDLLDAVVMLVIQTIHKLGGVDAGAQYMPY